MQFGKDHKGRLFESLVVFGTMVQPPRTAAIRPSRYLLQCLDKLMVRYARPSTKLTRIIVASVYTANAVKIIQNIGEP